MIKEKTVQDLKKQLEQYSYQEFSHIIILCIGTNKIIGDLIGPMVGQILKKELKYDKIIILGNMIETINFKNAKQSIESIFEQYAKPFIITIDSALGRDDMVNQIVINKGMVKIGKSLGRSICYYSNINIKGVVGVDKKDKYENIKSLQNVDIELITKLSIRIVNITHKIIKEIGIENK